MKRIKKIQTSDTFAAIGALRQSRRDEQLQPALIGPLPPVELPRMRRGSRWAFAPAPQLATPADLTAALRQERRRVAPFLRDLAPKLVTTRHRRVLREFDWRVVARDNAQAFAAASNGRGPWQRVTVPHYGPPEGRALAYYRTEFRVPANWSKPGSLWLRIAGADYHARLYVNGRCVGEHEGFFATFECEISAALRRGPNTLLIELRNDGTWNTQNAPEGDKLYAATGPGWDAPGTGWHHCPAGMGLLGPVTLETRPRLFIADVWARPLPTLDAAEIRFEVHNCDTTPQPCTLELAVFGQNFRATPLSWHPLDRLAPAAAGLNYYACTVALPQGRRWDTVTPWLYQIQVRLRDATGRLRDTAHRQFGLRTFRIDETTKPKGRIFLNDEPIRLRGANTMGFEQLAVMRGQPGRLRDDLLLARLTNFNFLRLTQRPVQPEVYEMADRVGLMLQTDLPLFAFLRRPQFCEAVRQAREMARHVRAHPSVVLLTYINEPFPAQWRPVGHRHVNRTELEGFFQAATAAIRVEHPDIAIKPVDGDYDPPADGLPDYHLYCLWYQGHGQPFGRLHKGEFPPLKRDWCFGCGEFGAEGLDPVGLMRRRYPTAWLPQNPRQEAVWTPNQISQAQTGRHQPLFFDRPGTLAAWVESSQAWQARAVRMQTEAFRRMDRMVSCAVHLFIDAWPAGWMKAIMDCERRPKSAWFACREALAPWLPMVRSDRFAFQAGEEHRLEVWLANDTATKPRGWHLRCTAEAAGRILASSRWTARPQACTPTFQGFLPWVAPTVSERTEVILRLGLFDTSDRIVNDSVTRFVVWPQVATTPPVIALSVTGGPAEQLARELDARIDAQAGLILADRLPASAYECEELWQRVTAGATLVLTELPVGQHQIGPDLIEVKPCGFAPYDFVSRATGHPLVVGFDRDDFRFWHEPAADTITPLLPATFQAPGWTPILLTGEAGWGTPALPALAAAEKTLGKGRIIVSLLSLAGRTCTNPVAHIFASRLLQSDHLT